MLRLDLAQEPHWLDLGGGVRLKLLPLTTALMVAARSDPDFEALGEDVSDEMRALMFGKAIARRAVLEWEGVGDADGNPVAPSPAGIDALLDLYPLFESFQLDYVNKGLVLAQEKTRAGAGKKRLRALAEWHFGGGGSYCAACAAACPDCPARLNRPETLEGHQLWDLVLRLAGQFRAVPGAVLGWDLGAALALARALGVNPLVAAEVLPEIEVIAVRALNEQLEAEEAG